MEGGKKGEEREGLEEAGLPPVSRGNERPCPEKGKFVHPGHRVFVRSDQNLPKHEDAV